MCVWGGGGGGGGAVTARPGFELVPSPLSSSLDHIMILSKKARTEAKTLEP